MTPAQRAKAAGFKNFKQVVELSGWPRQTLVDMAKNQPHRFNIVLQGCLVELENKGINA